MIKSIRQKFIVAAFALLFILGGLSFVLSTQQPSSIKLGNIVIPPDAVYINPGTNIQGVINSNTAGKTYVLKAGVHRNQTVTPKQGDQIIGEVDGQGNPLTILDGSIDVNGFTYDGTYWQATVNFVKQPEDPAKVPCRRANGCNFPEDVFIDDQPLLQVRLKSEVNSNDKFAIETVGTNSHRIFMRANPTGKDVTLGVTKFGISSKAKNVTVANVIVQKYANTFHTGAIWNEASGDTEAQGGGWLIDNVVTQLNHNTGVNILGNTTVRNSKINQNGHNGILTHIYGGTSFNRVRNIVVEDNEIAYNNYAGYQEWWEGGGSKFQRVTGAIIRDNHWHHNTGPGLWLDIENIDILVEGNLVEYNTQEGIKNEINHDFEYPTGTGNQFDIIIRNNLSRYNGSDQANSGWIWGGQIFLQNAEKTLVENNTVFVHQSWGNGITMVHQNRGGYTDKVFGNRVRNNKIYYESSQGRSGGASDMDAYLETFYAQSGIFNNNQYFFKTSDNSTNRYVWGPAKWGSTYNISGFRSRGMETTGTETKLTSFSVCGDGIVQSPNSQGVNEVCDDGNVFDGDQCSADCLNSCTAPQVWNGTSCSTPAQFCGDGIIQSPNDDGVNEVCDDGNNLNGDLCSADCLNSCTAPQIWNGTECISPFSNEVGADYFIIQAENYDPGGQNVGYFDTTTGNTGGVYRTDDVDIKAIPGGYAVGWFNTGEWLNFTINVPQTGTYTATLRGSATQSTNSLRMLVNGNPLFTTSFTPSVSFDQLIEIQVPNLSLTTGSNTFRVESVQQFFDLDFIRFDLAEAPEPPPAFTINHDVGSNYFVVQAEDYNLGGQGVAYNDTTPGNNGGVYRNDDVDIKTIVGGGYAVGWMDTGEWLEYTVNSPQAGVYALTINAATLEFNNSIRIDINGSPVTTTQISNTGGYDIFQDKVIENVLVPAGTITIRVTVLQQYLDLNFLRFDLQDNQEFPINHQVGSNFFVLQAENYNNGGLGFGYYDLTAGNGGGVYRNDDVDIKALAGGGYAVNSFSTGEWMEYTVNVPTNGTYRLTLRAAADNNINRLRLYTDGVETSNIIVPNTGSFNTFTNVEISGIALTQGQKTFRLQSVQQFADIDYLRFDYTGPLPSGSGSGGTGGSTGDTGGSTTGGSTGGSTGGTTGGTTQPISNRCKADYTGNNRVGLGDFAIFAQNWRRTGINCALDLANNDCFLNIFDFAVFASVWQSENVCF